MEETMNTGMDVSTEVSETAAQEVSVEEISSGPSKGFVALVVGGIAAAGIGVAVMIKKHKKKKAEAQGDDLDCEIYEDEFEDDTEEDPAVEDFDNEEPAKNKG